MKLLLNKYSKITFYALKAAKYLFIAAWILKGWKSDKEKKAQKRIKSGKEEELKRKDGQ